MKRHLMSSTTSQHADDRNTAHATVANGSDAAPAHSRPRLTLVHTRAWSHTLILRGSLDRRSASELEDEIECLRQEGVTALTLDLRQLDAIDPRGAQVIASQRAPFEVQGPRFAVLVRSAPDSRCTCPTHRGSDWRARRRCGPRRGYRCRLRSRRTAGARFRT